jgi:beta-1,4-mannooligosaccharide/beta-1,4-mannosyl-N-acetylglucosamine phosphorylase
MGKIRIIGEPVPHLPWRERPEECTAPVWRHPDNPIIGRNPVAGVARIFNSAVVPYQGRFAGIFRGETVNGRPYLYMGFSKNGLDWEIGKDRIVLSDERGKPFQPAYAYDPRLIKVEDSYYIIWCTDFMGAALGLAKTVDFKKFTRLENPFLPFNRNGVLFPKKINGKFMMLSRPSDGGHTPFGDIFLSESPDLTYWGNHRHVMSRGGKGWWQSLKIGAGAAPIETSEGWLLFYHGVTQTCSGYVYSMGGAILDLKQPSRVKYRCEDFLLTPETWYEERGFVPNVVFPCAALTDAKTGRIALYYGCADTYVGVAYTDIGTVTAYIKEHSEVVNGDQDHGKV